MTEFRNIYTELHRRIIGRILTSVPLDISRERLTELIDKQTPIPCKAVAEMHSWMHERNAAIEEFFKEFSPPDSVPCAGGPLTHIPPQNGIVPLEVEKRSQDTFLLDEG